MLEWNGNNGKVYFYQSEYPYDVSQANYADKGFAAYNIGASVSLHEGYGVGAYSFFRDHDVRMPTGIKTPSKSGIRLDAALTVKLDGNGGISHVVDDQGAGALSQGHSQYVCYFDAGNPLDQVERFLQ